jgi:hypothetical protein
MLNGARKNLSNLVLNFVTYLRDTTLEVISKPRRPFKNVPLNSPLAGLRFFRNKHHF